MREIRAVAPVAASGAWDLEQPASGGLDYVRRLFYPSREEEAAMVAAMTGAGDGDLEQWTEERSRTTYVRADRGAVDVFVGGTLVHEGQLDEATHQWLSRYPKARAALEAARPAQPGESIWASADAEIPPEVRAALWPPEPGGDRLDGDDRESYARLFGEPD